MEGAMSCVKYLVFIFNFLFWVSGIAIIVVGSLIYVQLNKYGDVLNDNFTAAVVLLIVVGCIVTIIAFFGCCGACKENHCMIMTFAVLLGIIFVLELAAGITCYVYRSEIDSIALKEFNNAWSSYGQGTGPESEGITKTIDLIQHDLKCCGVNNYTDYSTYPWGKSNPGVPKSCCNSDLTRECNPALPTDIYTEGCYYKLKSELERDVLVVAGFGVGIAFIQLIGVAFACCMASAIRKNYEVV
ncbi:hypothetical protein CHUAL_002501 [Chamberlinius hualienensis]